MRYLECRVKTFLKENISWKIVIICLYSLQIREFIELALRDIDRFQRQKTKDLQEIFTNYAVMQIKQCKKVRLYLF